MTSLLAQGQTKVMAWISSMGPRSLRGLVNELSERQGTAHVSTTKVYQSVVAEKD